MHHIPKPLLWDVAPEVTVNRELNAWQLSPPSDGKAQHPQDAPRHRQTTTRADFAENLFKFWL